MVDTFTASSGIVIEPTKRYGLNVHCSGHVDVHALGTTETEALREYFQRKRDDELGRWRDPEHPGIFAVGFDHDPNVVQVVKEEGGTAYMQARRYEVRGYPLDPMQKVARAYFAAHPVQARPEWHDAKPGEVWMVTVIGAENIPVVATTEGHFVGDGVKGPIGGPPFTAGRRIWPEDRP